jgi:hypothetical protein
MGDDTITASYFNSIVTEISETFCFADIFVGESTSTKHWDIFVIPESPVGVIALVGASLAAFGGSMFWKKRSRSSTEGLSGLGV